MNLNFRNAHLSLQLSLSIKQLEMVLHPTKQAQWRREHVCCPQEPSFLLCYRLPAVTYNHYVVERIGWVHHKIIVTEVSVKILLVHACYCICDWLPRLTSLRGTRGNWIILKWRQLMAVFIWRHIDNKLNVTFVRCVFHKRQGW